MPIDSDSKRILFVSHDASLTGAPIFLNNLLRYIKSNCTHYNVLIHCVNNGPLIKLLQEEGFRVSVFCKNSSSSNLLLKILHRLSYYLSFMALLNRFKPDLVYSNTIVNFSQVIIGRLTGAKTLVHMHEGHDFASKLRFRLRFSSIFTSSYITGSKYVANVLNKLTGANGVVIHNGITTPALVLAKLRRQKTQFTLCIIGTIDQNKAQLIAVKAVEYLARVEHLDIKLRIVGRIVDAEYGKEIKTYIKYKDLSEFISLDGQVGNIDDVYIDIDALIVSSLDEAFPTVILEAMAHRKPVIASDTGGIPEIVQDGITGLLFEKGNPIDLASKVKLLFNDNYLESKIISNAFSTVVTRFSLANANNNIVTTINGILDQPRSKISNC